MLPGLQEGGLVTQRPDWAVEHQLSEQGWLHPENQDSIMAPRAHQDAASTATTPDTQDLCGLFSMQ